MATRTPCPHDEPEWERCPACRGQREEALHVQLRQAQEDAKEKGALAARTGRTLARAQRIIKNLHTERAELIQRIAALTPAEAQERKEGG